MTCMFDRDEQCFCECKNCSRHKTFQEDLESGWYEVEREEEEE